MATALQPGTIMTWSRHALTHLSPKTMKEFMPPFIVLDPGKTSSRDRGLIRLESEGGKGPRFRMRRRFFKKPPTRKG